MTALTLPTSRLVGADLLKLRKSPSLNVVTAFLTIGSIVITVAIMETLHLANPAKHGPVGGVPDLGHFAALVGLLGAVAAAIVGARVGAGDIDAGVYRDLVVSGRSRLSLYLSRFAGGAAFLLPFVAVAYTIAAVSSVALAGSNAAPHTRVLVLTGLWAVLDVMFYFVLSVAISVLFGSASYAIGVVLALRLAVMPVVVSISALGIFRELMPVAAIESITPAALGNAPRMGPDIPMSIGAVAAVHVIWAALAVAFAGWRDVTRDA